MPTIQFTLIEADGHRPIAVDVGHQRLTVSPQTLEKDLGWTVKPEGFCRGSACVPADRALTADGQVNLAVFASLLGRPLVVDTTANAISLGVASADRAQSLQSLQAPDFTLPDLNGKLHSLSQYRGKKVLLAAYASW